MHTVSTIRCSDWQWLCAQTIVDGFQHEQPDYWLNFGNPWEIERLNVGYPINFYGHVSVQEEEGRQVFKWNPGETVGPPLS
jgi:starch phosphorylase